jgi:flagellar basal body-associated protein FliL
MDEQTRDGLTVIQVLSLVLVLGVVLTIAAWLWNEPPDSEQSNADAETQQGIANSQ